MRIDHPLPSEESQLRTLWQTVFGDSDAYLDLFFSTAYAPDHCMCIRLEQQILAAAYWLDCHISGKKAAYIYAVVTAPAHRGQGLCRQLMDAIHARLSAAGYCGSLLVPADTGLRRMYAGMGYENFGGIQEYPCAPADIKAPLQQLDATAFAALRRQYLPEYAVIQEGAQLALLEKLAAFYAGEDCLLTVADGRVLEYCGNKETAPGALAALGICQTTLRIPGNDPFAMYRPLTQDPTPTYFAFAFD